MASGVEPLVFLKTSIARSIYNRMAGLQLRALTKMEGHVEAREKVCRPCDQMKHRTSKSGVCKVGRKSWGEAI